MNPGPSMGGAEDGGAISLVRMQKRLGIKGDDRGRVLFRMLIAKERKLGHQIMVRMGGRKQGIRYRVSMGSIRRYARELLPSKVDELRKNMTVYLEDIDQRIRDGAANYVAEVVEPRLDELWERDEKIAEELDKLGKKVSRALTVGRAAAG